MKTLYLLRHAKASWQDQRTQDSDRPLSKQGLEEAAVIGKALASEQLARVVVVSSPAIRAKETTEIMLRSSGLESLASWEPKLYDADLPALLGVISRVEDDKDIAILVGHNPGMETLVRFLTGEIRAMPTAALAKVKLEVNSWKNLNGGEGRLEWLVTPEGLSGS